MATQASDIVFEPLSDVLGAEVRGLDLSKPLDNATVAELKRGWYEHIVLVFRGQDISNEDQMRFCSYFGELEAVRTGKQANKAMSHTMMITNVRDSGYATALEDGEMWFHGDQCYYEIPARASTLYAMEIPPTGGNTIFSNNYMIWDGLPDNVRARLDGLKARNIYDYAGNPTARGKNIDPNAPQYSHPVARTHPETGRKALYVNRLMTDYIEGIPRSESDALLEMMFDLNEEPRFLYEHVWRVGDLLLWDNRCSHHARTFFDPSHRRMMRRITVKGEPVF